MSFSELEQFVAKCEIPNVDRVKLGELFVEANKEDGGDPDDINPNEELLRYEFLEMLIRLGPESVSQDNLIALWLSLALYID